MSLLNDQINDAPEPLQGYVYGMETSMGNVALLIKEKFELEKTIEGLKAMIAAERRSKMEEGNSLRDHMKDSIRGYLMTAKVFDMSLGSSKDIISEMTYDLVDIVFGALAIPEENQDKNWEDEVNELEKLFEARMTGNEISHDV